MSYILDALRRAESERQRGQPPGLHAQPATASPPPAAPPRVAALGWLGLGLALAAAAGLALSLLHRDGAPALQAPLPPAAPLAPAAMPQPAPVVAAPPAPAPLPQVVSAPPPAPAPTHALPTPAPAPREPPVAAAALAQPTAVALAGLTPEQHRDLPPLVISGSIWSESAEHRYLIVNGQVVREGQAAAPGVVLERIGPRAAVVRWRDLRVELPF
jgi:general secretion pathway protein B